MKIEFKKPVMFSTIHRAFVGDGIPPIPEDTACLAVSAHTVVFIAPSGEVWEYFLGHGTSEKSETYYWPSLDLCPRTWVREASKMKLS